MTTLLILNIIGLALALVMSMVLFKLWRKAEQELHKSKKRNTEANKR